jgi:hypothetical protein
MGRRKKNLAIIEDCPQSSRNPVLEYTNAEKEFEQLIHSFIPLFENPLNKDLKDHEKHDLVIDYCLQRLNRIKDTVEKIRISTEQEVREEKKGNYIYHDNCTAMYEKNVPQLNKLHGIAARILNQALLRYKKISPNTDDIDDLKAYASKEYSLLKNNLTTFLLTLQTINLDKKCKPQIRRALLFDIDFIQFHLEQKLPASDALSLLKPLSLKFLGETSELSLSFWQKLTGPSVKDYQNITATEFSEVLFNNHLLLEASSDKEKLKIFIAHIAHLNSCLTVGNWKTIQDYSVYSESAHKQSDELKELANSLQKTLDAQIKRLEVVNRYTDSTKLWGVDLPYLRTYKRQLHNYKEEITLALETIQNSHLEQLKNPLLSDDKFKKNELKTIIGQLDEITNEQSKIKSKFSEVQHNITTEYKTIEHGIKRLEDYIESHVEAQKSKAKRSTESCLAVIRLVTEQQEFEEIETKIRRYLNSFLLTADGQFTLSFIDSEKKRFDELLFDHTYEAKQKIRSCYERIIANEKQKIPRKPFCYDERNLFATELEAAIKHAYALEEKLMSQYYALTLANDGKILDWHKEMQYRLSTLRRQIKEIQRLNSNAYCVESRIASKEFKTSEEIIKTLIKEQYRLFNQGFSKELEAKHGNLTAKEALKNSNTQLLSEVDVRIPILLTIMHKIESVNNDYLSLKIQEKDFQKRLVATVEEELHNDHMECLSEGKRGKLLQWVRINVLKPLANLGSYFKRKLCKDNSSLNLPIVLFASQAEKNMINLGNEALQALSSPAA